MSQAGSNSGGGGPIPPSVATQYVLDQNSPAIAAANILKVKGGYTGLDNIIGIQTNNTNSDDNNIIVELTNRFAGLVTTTNDTTAQVLLSFTYPLPGTYTFEFKISAYNVTDQLSASYWIQIGRRSNGSAAFSYGPFNSYSNEDATMENVIVNFPASYAAANQIGIEVTGLAGKTINWVVTGIYNFAGA